VSHTYLDICNYKNENTYVLNRSTGSNQGESVAHLLKLFKEYKDIVI